MPDRGGRLIPSLTQSVHSASRCRQARAQACAYPRTDHHANIKIICSCRGEERESPIRRGSAAVGPHVRESPFPSPLCSFARTREKRTGGIGSTKREPMTPPAPPPFFRVEREHRMKSSRIDITRQLDSGRRARQVLRVHSIRPDVLRRAVRPNTGRRIYIYLAGRLDRLPTLHAYLCTAKAREKRAPWLGGKSRPEVVHSRRAACLPWRANCDREVGKYLCR